VVKDRLYTLAAKHPKRRSTQTALHRLVTGLCQMLSPMLAFTADEAWEFIPGVEASVHESEWQLTQGVTFSTEAEATWSKLFKTRAEVLPFLERERQSKTIGKALDAKVTLLAPEATGLALEKVHQDDLKELLNVSQLILKSEELPIDLDGAYQSNIEKADGQKCDRCWHWETDVGVNPEYPLICSRCVEAEKANQPA
jgi:isoleucyl-tRNA synthetase